MRDDLDSERADRDRAVGRYKCLVDQMRREFNARQTECEENRIKVSNSAILTVLSETLKIDHRHHVPSSRSASTPDDTMDVFFSLLCSSQFQLTHSFSCAQLHKFHPTISFVFEIDKPPLFRQYAHRFSSLECHQTVPWAQQKSQMRYRSPILTVLILNM